MQDELKQVEETEKKDKGISYIFTFVFFIINAICMTFCEMIGAVKSKAIIFSLITSIVSAAVFAGLFYLTIEIIEKIIHRNIKITAKHLLFFIAGISVLCFLFAPVIIAVFA